MKPDLATFKLKKSFQYDDKPIESGTMREPNALDEIAPMGDDRVKKNPAYAIIIKLTRVTTFNGFDTTNTKMIETLPAVDLQQLMEVYQSFFPSVDSMPNLQSALSEK